MKKSGSETKVPTCCLLSACSMQRSRRTPVSRGFREQSRGPPEPRSDAAHFAQVPAFSASHQPGASAGEQEGSKPAHPTHQTRGDRLGGASAASPARQLSSGSSFVPLAHAVPLPRPLHCHGRRPQPGPGGFGHVLANSAWPQWSCPPRPGTSPT